MMGYEKGRRARSEVESQDGQQPTARTETGDGQHLQMATGSSMIHLVVFLVFLLSITFLLSSSSFISFAF
ncbi:hypothetical protein XA68_17972 [Ophiocordyceps unilateralis]|uniref:Uncharacterized protein n=1 Tax=Ophiocordyceps unilateralis TaxID=268505 RepID=A0A2A9PK00_OPHUN|nr:hypothetical protein XA68_17972 [Ophiocordyceps unilateralis]